MAEQVKIVAESRSEAGKGPARRLRAEGRVPAVVYGSRVSPAKLHVDALDLYHALHTSAGLNVLIRLQVDGDEHLTIAREVQRHPVRGDLVHVDFVAFDRESLIRVEIPVHLEGTEDVESPGVVQHTLHTIPIRVKPLDIPDWFTLQVGELTIGDTLRVEDIDLPAGAEFDIETDRAVVSIVAPTVIEEEEEELPEGLAELMEGLEGELSEEELAEMRERLEAGEEEAIAEIESAAEAAAEAAPSEEPPSEGRPSEGEPSEGEE